jgi:hypothetical protein
MLVTPAQAKQWLETSNTHNRALSRAKVSRFVNYLKTGFWKHTHHGIAFSEGGVLLDGQHRLTAVAESGIAAIFDVTFNASSDIQAAIDVEGGRTPEQCLKLGMGLDVGKDVVSIARMMIDPIANTKPSVGTLHTFILMYNEPIQWAHSIFTSHIKQVTTAPLFATVARASVTEDRERLNQFARCLMSGIIADQGDVAAVRLVRVLTSSRTGSNGSRSEVYRYCQRAVRAFLDREPIDKLYKASEECFPLPDERKQSKKAS